MINFLKFIGRLGIVGIALFILSLIIYFFNLDVKLSAKMIPALTWWHDRAAKKRAEKDTKKTDETV